MTLGGATRTHDCCTWRHPVIILLSVQTSVIKPSIFKCKCKCKRRIKCKCKCKASESNASTNANAQQLNQMQLQMHLNQIQMHLDQMLLITMVFFAFCK